MNSDSSLHLSSVRTCTIYSGPLDSAWGSFISRHLKAFRGARIAHVHFYLEPHLYHVFCSGFDSEIPTRPHVLKFKVFEFLIFMHSKWARRQLPGTVTKWSKFHQFTSIYNEQGKSDRPKIIKLTFFQFAAVCGNLRSFCGFLRSFCRVQFLRLRPKKKKWTFLARATLVESRLAQIALQGPCTMQNWKTYAISEDLCVWHVLGIWDRCSKCGTICKCTKKCYERGYR